MHSQKKGYDEAMVILILRLLRRFSKGEFQSYILLSLASIWVLAQQYLLHRLRNVGSPHDPPSQKGVVGIHEYVLSDEQRFNRKVLLTILGSEVTSFLGKLKDKMARNCRCMVSHNAFFMGMVGFTICNCFLDHLEF